MSLAIVHGTPVWVWGLLVGLVAYGLSQTRTREVGHGRLRAVPVAMTVLSALGTWQAFGASTAAFGAWALGLVAVRTLVGRAAALAPAGVGRLPGTLRVPGSWWPLGLMMGIFATRYLVAVLLALHPSLGRDADFAAAVGIAYGGFAGAFLARAAGLLGTAPSARLAKTG